MDFESSDILKGVPGIPVIFFFFSRTEAAAVAWARVYPSLPSPRQSDAAINPGRLCSIKVSPSQRSPAYEITFVSVNPLGQATSSSQREAAAVSFHLLQCLDLKKVLKKRS